MRTSTITSSTTTVSTTKEAKVKPKSYSAGDVKIIIFKIKCLEFSDIWGIIYDVRPAFSSQVFGHARLMFNLSKN